MKYYRKCLIINPQGKLKLMNGTNRDGRNMIEDSLRCGRKYMSKHEQHVEKVRKVVHSNRPLRMREVPDEAGISKKSCHEILNKNLGMWRVAAKSVCVSAD
jgi:hypothetical protein